MVAKWDIIKPDQDFGVTELEEVKLFKQNSQEQKVNTFQDEFDLNDQDWWEYLNITDQTNNKVIKLDLIEPYLHTTCSVRNIDNQNITNNNDRIRVWYGILTKHLSFSIDTLEQKSKLNEMYLYVLVKNKFTYDDEHAVVQNDNTYSLIIIRYSDTC